MNRREMLIALALIAAAQCLPVVSETNLFVSFDSVIRPPRGSISYNRAGGSLIYSIATDRRVKR